MQLPLYLHLELTNQSPSACIITALRIVTVNSFKNGDIDYFTGFDALWATLESDIGIILACVPVMQPVQSKFKEYLYSIASGFKSTSHRSLGSFSVKIRNKKPLKEPITVSRSYPLSSSDGIVDRTEPGTSLDQFDVEYDHQWRQQRELA